MAAAMVASVKIDGARVAVSPDPGACLDIPVTRLNGCLAAFCLLMVALQPLDALAQITESLVPYAVAPSAPQAPRSPYDPIGLRLGDFFWFPRAELDEAYNSNIFATPTSPTYDLITALTPSFDLLSIFPRNALNLHGSSLLQVYADHPAQNTQDGIVSADGRYRRDRREFVLRQRASGAPAHILRVSEFARQHCSAGNVLGLHC